MNFKESIYWQIYSDIWSFHKKYCDVREDDAYWEAAVDESSIIYEKYKEKPEREFAKRLIITVAKELERVGEVKNGAKKK